MLKYIHLRIQQATVNTLVNHVEGKITFPPIYKCDIFFDDYDTSGDCTTPAWTDHVFFQNQHDQGANPDLLAYYGRAELKQGDHQPVMAFFSLDILHTDMECTRAVLEEV